MPKLEFLESPSNRTGLAIWLATVITAAVQYSLLREPPPSADLLGLVIGFVKLIEPENAVTVLQLQRAMADLSAALSTKSPVAVENVVADAESIAAGILGKQAKP